MIGTLRIEAALLALVLVVVPAPRARARVDQGWLRQWQEAQRYRPPVLESEGRIAPGDEPGTPLIVDGQVFEPDGATPAVDVVVFAYHTDRDGLYSRPGEPGAWRLRGWVRTDETGRFRFHTVRPAPYPDRSDPAHIHVTFDSPLFGRQWTRSVLFADDPLVSAGDGAESAAAGRFGNVCEVHMRDGVSRVQILFRLKTSADF